MKKAFALFLSILLLLAVSTASAYDGEFTFQQIPWGSSISEVEAQLKTIYGSDLTVFTKPRKVPANGIILYVDENNTLQSSAQIWDYVATATISGKIAGYRPSMLVFMFAVPAEKDLEDPDNGELFCAGYMLQAPNRDEAFADLQNKLTQLYGEPNDVSGNLAFWAGTNDTLIHLSDTNVVYMKTAKPDEVPYHICETESTPVPSNDADPSDHSGL